MPTKVLFASKQMTTALFTAPSAADSSPTNGLLEFERPLGEVLARIDGLERDHRSGIRDWSAELRRERAHFQAALKDLYANLTPWETVLVARHPRRPLSVDYLGSIFRDFCELHGDRTFSDDRAILTGFARIGRHKVMFVGHNKGRDIKERVQCNFGCAHPEGYRKALQKMRLAEKYKLPVVCLIDTQGAYPGVGSEERGISQAIAVNLMEMSRLRTPIVCAVIGEGGSGGALGIGVGDRIAMFQHSFYSVISPEGCAAILWKTADRRRDAAEALRLTAPELLKLGLIDEIIPEPIGGAHRNPEAAAASLEKYLVESLNDWRRISIDALLRRRRERIRQLGSFFEAASDVKPAKPDVVGSAAVSPMHIPRRAGTARNSRTARLKSHAVLAEAAAC